MPRGLTGKGRARRLGWTLGWALAGAALWLALAWLPAGRAGPGGGPVAWAAPVITGTVVWKGSDTPVPDVAVVAKDPKSGIVVSQARTDGTGEYILPAAVGNWLVEVPSTAQYWGYAQTVTAFPHEQYHLDFGITTRPREAPTPVVTPPPPAVPTATLTVPPAAGGGSSPAPGTAPPGKLPRSGRPIDDWPAGPAAVLGAGLALLGWRLRRRALGARPARREPR